MAVYPVKNTKTGEKKEVTMSITKWDQWLKDNPDWKRCWEEQELPLVQYQDRFLRGMHGRPDDYGTGQNNKWY